MKMKAREGACVYVLFMSVHVEVVEVECVYINELGRGEGNIIMYMSMWYIQCTC